MKKANVGAVFRWNGELVKVVGVAEGKTIIFEPINNRPCEICNRKEVHHVLEHSPLFQNDAEAVDTITPPLI